MHDVPPPQAMLQMLGGFQVSQALYAAAKLGVADRLVDGPVAVAGIAEQTGAQVEPMRRLLRSLASIGVFTEVERDTFGLTPMGGMLVTDAPGSMRDLCLMWMETHYLPFSELLGTIQTGAPAAEIHLGQPFFDWLGERPHHVSQFSRAMDNLTQGIKLGAMPAVDLSGASTVVDVGGADGRMLCSLLGSVPDARGIVFDLPHVVGDAGKVIADGGLSHRVSVVGGDFFRAVPAADTYFMAFVLHDWSDAHSIQILRNIRAAGGPGARLRSMEFVVPPGDVPHPAKMIDLTMLGMVTGRERTTEEFDELFAAAGFHLDRVVDTPAPINILEATAV